MPSEFSLKVIGLVRALLRAEGVECSADGRADLGKVGWKKAGGRAKTSVGRSQMRPRMFE